MIKIKTTLLGSALTVALSATPTIAADFHALAELGATPAPLQDGVLASTEGGVVCFAGGSSANSGTAGGVCLVAVIPFQSFSVANPSPVTVVHFLQVPGSVNFGTP
jgi:hypothetical protein